MLRLWLYFCRAVLAANVAVHLSTYVCHLQREQVWPLHVLTMLAFAPCVFLQNGEELNGVVWGKVSRAVKWLIRIGVVYFILTMAILIVHTENGEPERVGNRYIISDHGREVGEATREQYETHRDYVLRGFSCFWILFSGVPTLFILYALPRRNKRSIEKTKRNGDRAGKAGVDVQPNR